ncbi:hypothetical protein BH11MYX3_BH11MYX3_37710 [soil metagenome]
MGIGCTIGDLPSDTYAMRLLLHVCACIALGSSVAGADPASDVTQRLETITSKSTHAKADVPRFAFTSNVTWEDPANLDEALFGLPALTLVDKSKTVVGFADPDTAFVTTQIAEFSTCPAAGGAKATPETWLRATAVFEKTAGIWQPIAWAITPPIPGDSQVAAMSDGIVPDRLTRNVTGADAVALLFETTMGNPTLLAAAV